MNILETTSNAWGQQVLEGANLELVGLFFAAGIILMLAHAAGAAWLRRGRRNGSGDD